MNPPNPKSSRREFFTAGTGLGAAALSWMLSRESLAATPQQTPKVRRVIWLFMHGGPSHVDLFDPKPELVRYAGKPVPESFGKIETRRDVAKNPLLAPIRPFRKRGRSGLEISDFLPHIAECADELCVLRSVHGDSVMSAFS